MAREAPHDRAVDDGVLGEAGDNGFDVAVVERRGVAREKVVDRDPVLDRWLAHSEAPLWSFRPGVTAA